MKYEIITPARLDEIFTAHTLKYHWFVYKGQVQDKPTGVWLACFDEGDDLDPGFDRGILLTAEAMSDLIDLFSDPDSAASLAVSALFETPLKRRLVDENSIKGPLTALGGDLLKDLARPSLEQLKTKITQRLPAWRQAAEELTQSIQRGAAVRIYEYSDHYARQRANEWVEFPRPEELGLVDLRPGL
jgi:hypothetical protein